MTAIIEKFDSREGTEGEESPSAELLWLVTGTEDETAVRTLIDATAPATYLDLYLQDYHYQHLGNGHWECSARYGKRDPNESSYTFDTGGGTQHITQSLQTIASYAPPAKVAPNFKQAIGVTTDSVDGADITVPVYNFTETHYLADAVVTAAYKLTLFTLTGRTNNALYKGFAEGELLFLGASGSKRGKDDWEITFRFSASPNVTGLQVGDITGIAKKGWQYLWVRYADAEDANVLVKQPIAAYVERVYESGDFTLLGI